MGQRRESDDAERVQRTAASGHVGDREMCECLRHEDVVDGVVDAAGGAKAEYVPVLDQVRFTHGYHKDARLARGLDDAQRVDMGAVLDTGGEAPRSAEAEPVAVGDRHPRPRALT